jgi:chromosomal replication initiation ATPase DnaA
MGELALVQPTPQSEAFSAAMRCLVRLVAALFDLDPDDFTGPNKGSPHQVLARQSLIYLLHTEGGFEQTEIADALGRHHSTAWHAIRVVTGLRDDDEIDRAFTLLGEVYQGFRSAQTRVPDLMVTYTR